MANDDPVPIREFAYQYRVSIETVRRWIKEGQIPWQMKGGRYMIRTGDAIHPLYGAAIGQPDKYDLSSEYMVKGLQMTNEEMLKQHLVEEKRKEFGETLSVLDTLRRTRKARGGVGAPLQVPGHLKDAARGEGIVITDADIAPFKLVRE